MLITFIEKVKISGIDIISCGCLKNNTVNVVLEKNLRDVGIRKKDCAGYWD